MKITTPGGAVLEVLDAGPQRVKRRTGVYVRVISTTAESRFYTGEVERLYLPASELRRTSA